MAGGQERILRRRIRTIESTKKITKALELIAASQIVPRPGAHRRFAPLCACDLGHPRRDRPRRRQLDAPGWDSRVTAERPRARDRGRPGLGGRLQLERAAGRRAPAPSGSQTGQSHRVMASARRRRLTSGFVTRASRGSSWACPTDPLRGRPAGSRRDRAAVPRRRHSTSCRSSRPGSLRRHASSSRPASCSRSAESEIGRSTALRRIARGARDRSRGHRRRRRRSRLAVTGEEARLHRVRAGRRAPAGPAHAPRLGGRDLRRAAGGVALRSTLPASGPWRRPPTMPTSWSRRSRG